VGPPTSVHRSHKDVSDMAILSIIMVCLWLLQSISAFNMVIDDYSCHGFMLIMMVWL
jgi:hypothetical protein